MPATLKALGLRVQLGNHAHKRCGNPIPASNDDFTVLDNFGVHPVGLDYCGCETAQERTTQLLRISWFPATNLNPKTAATFRVLETFHLLSFESKCSGFEFYRTLARMTDNTTAYSVTVSTIYNILPILSINSCFSSGPLLCLHAHGPRMETHQGDQTRWPRAPGRRIFHV